MDVGMMWFDNNKSDRLEIKIQRASSYYKQKYGHSPNLCFVHPSMLLMREGSFDDKKEPRSLTAEIELRSSKSLLPNHFWLGFNQESNAVQP